MVAFTGNFPSGSEDEGEEEGDESGILRKGDGAGGDGEEDEVEGEFMNSETMSPKVFFIVVK